MKNRLSDLNDHLFAQIERLSEEGLTPEKLETEVKRGNAIVAVADQILRHASLQVQAAKILADSGDLNASRLLPELGTKKATGAIEGPKQ
jgi:cyanate lyase